ncbi:hypothetical protein LJC59_01165 [Desulfovibrio sp. OttesenSCG-928-A18]|nr:hypothetical protein [Desulfovibrio sp. OttesenSCG-928-A18]
MEGPFSSWKAYGKKATGSFYALSSRITATCRQPFRPGAAGEPARRPAFLQNIAKHLKAIFADGELLPDSVVNQQLTTAADGKQYRVRYYNLEAMRLCVRRGYRTFSGTTNYTMSKNDFAKLILKKKKGLRQFLLRIFGLFST